MELCGYVVRGWVFGVGLMDGDVVCYVGDDCGGYFYVCFVEVVVVVVGGSVFEYVFGFFCGVVWGLVELLIFGVLLV